MFLLKKFKVPKLVNLTNRHNEKSETLQTRLVKENYSRKPKLTKTRPKQKKSN